ncbi:myotubularin-related protein 3 isoform X2 [Ornithorhynchus anatinus]|uniref:myotubularin-related protein 3 isoform X2 n=1 Tax=Ornithorhynchus anatinus TaxID=9258 RepID=UPI0010A93434|nr:myotubularin-related protein 3 isoform X2 [Ornithorhynchus anatinus]
MDEETQHSLECIQANQIFPRKQLIREEENLQVPFLELHGESTEYVGRAEDAVIALSNYRLHIKFKESLVNTACQSAACEMPVPLQLIESVECRDIFQLHLTCKDCKVIRCQFSTFEQCQEWLKRLNNAIRPPSKIEDLFSFAYHAWCMEVYASEKEQHGDLCRPGEHVTSRFKNEVERMGFDMNNAWRISNINEKYKLCSSYPQELIVPAWITDKELESVASFRSWKRIPAVVFRHQNNGAVIARCGQPEVSWWGWRNADDEHLVQSVARACASDSCSGQGRLANGSCPRDFANGDLSDAEFDSSLSNASGAGSLAIQPQKLLILDARSYAAAVANRAKGGGCECPEYYPNCEVVFMGMANIHSIRKSFQSLRLLCSQMPDPGNWLSALESTKWLQHLSVLLKSALLVVHAVDRDQRPVLVHCSDGWDRTPQIVALAKLLLDPYYRTIEGFQVLVEMEWLDFGHKFADRCGHGENSDDLNERCPVFLQWLDCVHQLQRQFPCSFEFNEAFLVKLVQHTYSCLFGTFLGNNAKERGEKHTQERTCSVWSLLRAANKAFKNLLYSSQSETVLYPVCHVRNLMVWSAVYLPCSSPSTPAEDSGAPYPGPGPGTDEQPLGGRLPKTRSFDNLTTACDSHPAPAARRSSDPSLNEKWQEHRRSLELSGLGPAGEDPWAGDGPGRPGRTLPGAELSVAAGVAEGQMENILQEATKEDGGPEGTGPREEARPAAGREDQRDAPQSRQTGLAGEAPPAAEAPPGLRPPRDTSALQEQRARSPAPGSGTEGAPREAGPAATPPERPAPGEAGPGRRPPDPEPQPGGPPPLATGPPSAAGPAEEPPEREAGPERGPGGPSPRPPPGPHLPDGQDEGLAPRPNRESLAGRPGPGTRGHRTPGGGGGPAHGPHGSVPSRRASADRSQETVCNGEPAAENEAPEEPPADPEDEAPEKPAGPGAAPAPDGHRPNGAGGRPKGVSGSEPARLPRRNSRAKRAPGGPWRPPAAGSPDQPSRSHLDDDGTPVYADVIQQRLRQMESGHQHEVDALRKQVQELRSRLESRCLNGPLRCNGHFADAVTPMPDLESNLDPNCLSHCGPEIFSEASWEQVDKQDTEVTRWLPDHLAAHCYGCDGAFWLASRKHHCRNCGNVFCATCCNQKVPVPSQQLFEPSRVCKACYSHLHPPGASLDLELDKPIAATSN